MKNSYLNFITVGGLLLLAGTILFTACTRPNRDIAVIEPFDSQRYLGRWYEIARTDNDFQRGKTNAFATYSMNDDGSVRVLNQAYDLEEKQWGKAVGKAKFVDSATVGRLKVSFFGPFYGAYNVVAIDPDYQYVLVFGDSPKYMWILSRQKTIPDAIKADYLAKAKAFGIDIDALIWDKQERNDQPQ